VVLFPFIFKRFRKVVKIGIVRSVIVSVIILTYAVFSEYLLQYNNPASGIHSLFDSLWWVMQTVTTVGYGDTPVVGFYARLNGIFIMVAGIGSIGFILANLGVSIVNSQLARKLGQARTKMKEHVVICNYNDQASEIAEDIIAEGRSVLLLTNAKPKIEESNVDYVIGSCLVKEDLMKAGINKSDFVVILPDRRNESEDPAAIDAKSLVAAMTIKKINPDVYIVAELLQRASEIHAREIGVDEIVIRGNISSMLISNAILNPGVSKLYSELLSVNGKLKFNESAIGPEFLGKPFLELKEYMEKTGKIILALRKGDDLFFSPDPKSKIDANYAIFITSNKPA
jgi:voltage-gated potassium channel